MSCDTCNGQVLSRLPALYGGTFAGTTNEHQHIMTVTQAGPTQADAVGWRFGCIVYRMDGFVLRMMLPGEQAGGMTVFTDPE